MNYSDNRWSSSFILPEHRRAMLDFEREQQRKVRPDYDDQQIQEFEYLIQDAFQSRRSVKITVFGEFGNRSIKCKINKFDSLKGQIIVSSGDDHERINLRDIMGIG